MWFKKCVYFGCLIFPILMVEGDSIEENENFNNHLGLDLIKNITEVNKTLKDLIKNFKSFEKIYKAEETLRSESSGSEIDEDFEEMKQKVKKRNRSQKEFFSTIVPSNLYQGTAYVYESINSHELQSEDKKDVKNIKIYQKNKRKEEKLLLEKINSDSKSASVSKELKDISEDEEEIVVEITKESEQTKTPKPKGMKTRFNVLHTVQEDIRSKESETLLKVGNQRIVHAEKFSPRTIWKDVVNRPIKLDRVVSIETGNLSEIDEDADEDVADDKNVDDTNLENSENYNQASNGSEEGLYLRSYGDTCLAMPVKKCKKAMKIVNKNVCKVRFKCKSEFKSDFVANYKRGCEKQYLYNVKDSVEDTTSTTTVSKKKSDDDYDKDDIDVEEDVFIIRENNGEKKIKADRRKQFITTVGNEIKNFSLPHLSLRDKYEKQCKKELRAKCIGAGNYAIKKTCSKHECDEKKTNALEKACKQECKQAFVLDDKSKDSSDGTSESSDSD